MKNSTWLKYAGAFLLIGPLCFYIFELATGYTYPLETWRGIAILIGFFGCIYALIGANDIKKVEEVAERW